MISADSKVYLNKTLNENWVLTEFMKSLLVDFEFEFKSDYINLKETENYLINSNSLSYRKTSKKIMILKVIF